MKSPVFNDYNEIPSAVQEYIMDQSDAYFISDIPLNEINLWAKNNLNLIAELIEVHHG